MLIPIAMPFAMEHILVQCTYNPNQVNIPTNLRMETTGQPMKIHISMETKLLLDTLGRFFTEHRGLVDVKGKVDFLQPF